MQDIALVSGRSSPDEIVETCMIINDIFVVMITEMLLLLMYRHKNTFTFTYINTPTLILVPCVLVHNFFMYLILLESVALSVNTTP